MKKLIKYVENFLKDNKKLLPYTYFRKYDFQFYVKLSSYISLFFGIISTLFLILIFLIFYKYLDIVIFLLSVSFGIIVFYISLFYFYIYPILAKEDYKREIELNLPFLALYMYTYASSNTNLIDIFRVIAKRNELGSLSREIKYLVNLIDVLGYDLSTSLLILANRTPSYSFKEFLYGLYSVIKGGGNLISFIKEYARNSIKDYEITLKAYNERISTLITLYSFIFVLFPLSILIISFIITYISGNVSILYQLYFFFFIILPLSYISYLYFIEIIQPKIQ
ncbi:MAG: hypothetical protein BXU00_03290 [Candidatus Nanoclepta minutus]|uniref:Type II secretion system protein GspF domain-containing protein n=1 Tax=Candidatus Nanoclepta minutus TaxID=1940235 RepID=A0A397WME9_9ARCH|nr:MAG: hypothetical protein BXU00_03290 [Candidatus Nanoclepta minutus]